MRLGRRLLVVGDGQIVAIAVEALGFDRRGNVGDRRDRIERGDAMVSRVRDEHHTDAWSE